MSQQFDMNEYLQQQSLLQSTKINANSNGEIFSKTQVQDLENGAHIQQKPQYKQKNKQIVQQQQEHLEPQQIQSQNNNGQPVTQPNNPLSNRNAQLKILSLSIDFAVALYCSIKLIIFHKLILFGKVWLFFYFSHLLIYRNSKPINRPLVTVICLWIIFFLLQQGVENINQQQIIFVILYFVQIIPTIGKIFGGICLFCCTCTCAFCCICVCISALIKDVFHKRAEKIRSSKIREELCSKNLNQITDRQCPICLQNGNQMNNQDCHHSFHPKCLQAWLDNHKTCPICRHQLY